MTDTSLDPMEASSAASALDDDRRLRFFLDHQDQIREWAALEVEVRAAVHLLLIGLLPDLERLARRHGPEVVVVAEDLDAAWPRIGLRRRSWPSGERAPVAVFMEWTKRVDPSSDTLCPISGIRLDGVSNKDLFPILKALAGQSQEVRAMRFKVMPGGWWIRRFERSQPAWYLDVAGWLDSLIEGLDKAWPVLASLVDQALDQLRQAERAEKAPDVAMQGGLP